MGKDLYGDSSDIENKLSYNSDLNKLSYNSDLKDVHSSSEADSHTCSIPTTNSSTTTTNSSTTTNSYSTNSPESDSEFTIFI